MDLSVRKKTAFDIESLMATEPERCRPQSTGSSKDDHPHVGSPKGRVEHTVDIQGSKFSSYI